MPKRTKNWEWWVLALLTLIGIAIRFWRLGEPNEIVFDETYYANWGHDYLTGTDFFDVHPPLGKLLIAVGIKLFGFTAFGWRFMVALAGCFVVPLTYYIALKVFGAAGSTSDPKASAVGAGMDSPEAKSDGEVDDGSHAGRANRVFRAEVLPAANHMALLAALFVLLDGLLLVQSRMALLDSFVITFSLGTYAAFLAYRDAPTRHAASAWLLATGLFLGLGIATKWTAVAPLGVILIWWLAFRKELPKVSPFIVLLSFVVIPLGIYTASFIPNERTLSFVAYLIDWHKQAWHFHHTLTATHPYQSRWWSWLYLQRPVWYHYKDIGGKIYGIIALGNPILWWASIVALLATVWQLIRHRSLVLLLPLLAFLANYLPWAAISRTEFQYYVVPGVPFLMIILAWWTSKWLQKEATQPTAWALIFLAIATFIFFFPLLIAYPVSAHYYQYHIWLHSWI